jgi:hypothetical protein
MLVERLWNEAKVADFVRRLEAGESFEVKRTRYGVLVRGSDDATVFVQEFAAALGQVAAGEIEAAA